MLDASGHSRVVLVLDEELSSYKGILRICQGLETDVHYFTCQHGLVSWLRKNYSQLVRSQITCCVVLDTQFKEIFLNHWFKEICANLPIILISRLGRGMPHFRQINEDFIEFIEKPFKLAAMKLRLERIFLLHEQLDATNQKFKSLTKRELETCKLLVKGCSSAEISEILGISIKTVKVHRANLIRKVEAKSIAELLRGYDVFTSTSNHSLEKRLAHFLS